MKCKHTIWHKKKKCEEKFKGTFNIKVKAKSMKGGLK